MQLSLDIGNLQHAFCGKCPREGLALLAGLLRALMKFTLSAMIVEPQECMELLFWSAV